MQQCTVSIPTAMKCADACDTRKSALHQKLCLIS